MTICRQRINRIICFVLALVFILAASGCVATDPGGNDPILQPDVTALPSETPEPDNSKDVSSFKGLVISKVYGNSTKKEAATSAGFIELYNSKDEAVDCSSLALYYKSPSLNEYKTFLFGSTVIPAKSYYLIKCAHNAKFDATGEIISIDRYDSFWNVEINAGEVCLILAAAANRPSADVLPENFIGAVSYFRATESYTFDTGCVDDLSKNEYAVRVALVEDSGWEIVELLQSSSAKLRQIVPNYSGGLAGEVKRCALNEVDFDHVPGCYDTEFDLCLSAAPGSTIYYTADGSDPRTSSQRKLYSVPIHLEDTTEMKIGRLIKTTAAVMGSGYSVPSGVNRLPGAHVIKACSVREGGEVSEVFTSTYFITTLLSQFNVTVMSLSMDASEFVGSEGFYNNYYVSENISNPRGNGVMEVFDKQGSRTGCSNVQLSVSGHGSSGAPMKSMKVFYRNVDNEQGGTEDKLYYDLFEGYSVNEKGQRITDFARLLLRNSGNDYGLTYIRDSYMQRVSRLLKVDTMAYAPALLFINGCFWGVYNARERYSGDYVESHHGIDKDNVAIIESDYSQVHTNQNAPFVLTSGLETDPQSFNTLMEYIRSRDLSVQKYFDYVADRLDLDSFMDMYVARMFFNAVDWPENNIKIWRNRAGNGDPSNYDTKWHFTMLDTDFGVGFYDNITHYTITIWGAMHSTHCVCGTIMHNLLKNEAFKEKFVLRFYEVVREIFTPEYLEAELDNIVNERAPFIYLQTQRWGADQNNYVNGVAIIREFVQKRHDVVYESFLSEMGYSDGEIRAKVLNEATVTFKLTRIEKAFVDGVEVTNNNHIFVPEGGIDVTYELVLRRTSRLTSVVYKDFKGNVLEEIKYDGLPPDNKITFRIDKPVKIEIVCEKTG